MALPPANVAHERRYAWRVSATGPDTGAVLIGGHHDLYVRAWSVTWSPVDTGIRDSIIADWQTLAGGPTTWTAPDGSAVTVRFAGGELSVRALGGDYWEVGPALLVEEPRED